MNVIRFLLVPLVIIYQFGCAGVDDYGVPSPGYNNLGSFDPALVVPIDDLKTSSLRYLVASRSGLDFPVRFSIQLDGRSFSSELDLTNPGSDQSLVRFVRVDDKTGLVYWRTSPRFDSILCASKSKSMTMKVGSDNVSFRFYQANPPPWMLKDTRPCP